MSRSLSFLKKMPAQQSTYFLLTVPKANWSVPEELPDGIVWMKGQEEIGEGGFHHYQLVVATKKKTTVTSLKKRFCEQAHVEHCRSPAANAYVWKEDTAVPDTRFELGSPPLKRNSTKDWEKIWESAKAGCLMEIPADVRIRCYTTFKKITVDYMEPEAIEKEVYCFWGPTETGKSKRAWSEATLNAFPKDPRSKFWDGYTGQENVVIDEFDGAIDICHMLRWLDRYPVIVEVKGASVILKARKIWLTSNVNPREWYTNAKPEQVKALLRRMTIIEYPFAKVQPKITDESVNELMNMLSIQSRIDTLKKEMPINEEVEWRKCPYHAPWKCQFDTQSECDRAESASTYEMLLNDRLPSVSDSDMDICSESEEEDEFGFDLRNK